VGLDFQRDEEAAGLEARGLDLPPAEAVQEPRQRGADRFRGADRLGHVGPAEAVGRVGPAVAAQPRPRHPTQDRLVSVVGVVDFHPPFCQSAQTRDLGDRLP
jgi:hypothetical protein